MKLENKPYREFITMTGDDLELYSIALKRGKFPPVDHFGVGDLFSMPWGYVKDMQEAIIYEGLSYKALTEAIDEYKIAPANKVYRMGIFHLKEFAEHLTQKIEVISNIESQKLSVATISAEEYSAGIENFNVYRSFPQKNSLAGGDPLKYEAVKQLKYYDCFLKLCYEAEVAAYRRELSKLMKNKKG